MTGTSRYVDRLRRAIAGLVILLLGLQVSQTFYPVTLQGADGETIQVVICGPEGLHTVTLNLSDGTVEDGPQTEITSKCPFCVVGLPAALEAPHRIARPALYHRIRYALAAETEAHPRPAARVKQIRAPPQTA
ncbi:MAG: DUF2946 family protein [Pseudodonghicola sp.]